LTGIIKPYFYSIVIQEIVSRMGGEIERFRKNAQGKNKEGKAWKGFPRERFRQRPTFPQPRGCSIIGPGGLNGRVRDGNGWVPSGMATGKTGPPVPGTGSGGEKKVEAFPNKDEE
jgi:hypothetical protein